MGSFFEKLKRGMGVETPSEEEITEEPSKESPEGEQAPYGPGKVSTRQEKKTERAPKRKTPKMKIEKVVEVEESEKSEAKTEKREKVEAKEPARPERSAEKWPQAEGQLAIDVYETEEDFVIQSTIAGVKAADLDIFIDGNMVTIRGYRERPAAEEKRNYFYQECYWGPFSREIILPEEVDEEKAEATMKEGILTLKIPKARKLRKKKIVVKEEG